MYCHVVMCCHEVMHCHEVIRCFLVYVQVGHFDRQEAKALFFNLF